MRLYIIYALLKKEWQRHLANRGGLALAFLLVAAAVLLSVFDPGGASSSDGGGTGMVGGVHTCFLEYAEESSLIQHLKKSKPANLKVQFNARGIGPREAVTYSPGIGAIRLRAYKSPQGRDRLAVEVWHPEGDALAMAPYEQWFWRETRRHFQDYAVANLKKQGVETVSFEMPDFGNDDLWAVRESFHDLDRRTAAMSKIGPILQEVSIERQGLGGKVLDLRSAIATGMVVFALYFACVYLLPTLNCEERERGVLLAQALSPASPLEILTAKFLFYPVLGVGLAAVLAGIYKPGILSSLFFWLSLIAVAASFLGIGMTIATLAKTQRAAFLGAMCYLLSVSLILFIAGTNGIPFISNLAIEYHGPRILHASLSGEFDAKHWLHLAAAMGLASIWMTLAAWLFRRRGWQ